MEEKENGDSSVGLYQRINHTDEGRRGGGERERIENKTITLLHQDLHAPKIKYMNSAKQEK